MEVQTEAKSACLKSVNSPLGTKSITATILDNPIGSNFKSFWSQTEAYSIYSESVMTISGIQNSIYTNIHGYGMYNSQGCPLMILVLEWNVEITKRVTQQWSSQGNSDTYFNNERHNFLIKKNTYSI